MRFELATVHNQLLRAPEDETVPEVTVRHLAARERHLEDELDRAADRLRTAFPAYAQLRYPEPLSLSEVQQSLDRGTLLLTYEATGDEALVAAVRRTKCAMVWLGCTPSQLKELLDVAIGAYWDGEEGGPDAQQAQRRLAEFLVDPVPEAFFDGVLRVVIAPSGALAYLPFELLPCPGGQLLGDRYVITYTPSATVLVSLARKRRERPASWADREFVAFADPSQPQEADTGALWWPGIGRMLPRLPGTRREVERIARRFPGRSAFYFGERATEHRLMTSAEGYRYVHLATHGWLDDQNPLYSGLVVAPPTADELSTAQHLDDFLQVYEMFGLRLSAELVVCSACQTGLGRIQAGEGLVGMSRALFFAGARCLVLSLWPVADRPTERLMDRFYEFLAAGRTPPEALQKAKSSVRQTHPEVYRDPYGWAAFIAIGLG